MKLILLSALTFLLVQKTFSQKKEIETNRFLFVKNGKFGVIESLNNSVFPFIYDFIEYQNSRLIVRKKGLHGLRSTNNDEILPIAYEFILPRNYDRFILWTQKSKFGLCDNNGKIILPIDYKNVSSIESADFYTTLNNEDLNGVYSYLGEKIFPEIYKFFTRDGYKVFAIKAGQPQILNIQNPDDVVLLDPDITLIETVRHYTIGEQFFQIIKKNGKYGVINARNETIIPVIYQELKSSQDWRYFVIKENGKFGLVNVNGETVKVPIYDAIVFRKEYVLFRRKSKKEEIFFYK